ncbi:MAG TPA: fibronectin type III domain-containing protein [Thermotogota bacterium]|nr:fibronectin type III domain-containing protein [Thermotogota bacterium]HOF24067.1 fibronectin type III domain-containing protein [Thermotogota bacterium]HOS25347.1 fibronectin type III domain-containing protein [Thermotogota bacterium]HPD35830.1 fibronectin type III domain-containing protein [Thermotogota bacterium]HPL39442.1 fibronectin type III domain-containing protein [Thermotogota bacterium]
MRRKSLSAFLLLLLGITLLTSISGCLSRNRPTFAPPTIELTSPASGSTDLATPVKLEWEAAPGAQTNAGKRDGVTITEYEVNYKKTDGTGTTQTATTVDKSYSLTDLAYGTQYTWWVVAKQSDGQRKKSDEWVFSTQAAQYDTPEIALKSPEDGAPNQSTTLTLTWEATPGAQTNAGKRDGVSIKEYEVYHKKTGDPDPTEPATTVDQFHNLTNLAYETEYLWWVVAKQSDGKRATSTEWTFTTQAVQFDAPEIALKSPWNGAGDQPTTVTLTWEATEGKQTYVGERATAIEGYLVYFGVNGQKYGDPVRVTTTQQQRPGLAYGTTYKWQVVALQSDEKRATSTEWTFTTLAPVYGPPTIELTGPATGATDEGTKVTLTWEATPGELKAAGKRDGVTITGYEVYHKKTGDPDPTKPATTADNSYELENLEYGTEYTWKVVALQSDGQRATSTARTFTTMESLYNPPMLALTSPASRATNQATTVTLTWEATPGVQKIVPAGDRDMTISHYLVYFAAENAEYGEPEATDVKQMQKTGLEYDTTYKWKVKAVQFDGQSKTSDESTFSTLAPVYGPPTIELTSPASGATDRPTTLTLTWVATPGAQTNVGERAVSLTFRVYYQKEGGTKASTETGNPYYNLTDLDPEATYTWQVVAVQSDGQHATSTERTFKTRAGGATETPIKRYNSSGALQKEYAKLSEAIADAVNGDRIDVDGGKVLDNEDKQVTIDGKQITIRSSPTNNPFTIDMTELNKQGSNRGNNRVLEITGGASVTIRDAIITGGSLEGNDVGGGICITGGSNVTTFNVTVNDNTAGRGGGVGVYLQGAFNAHDTTITKNTAREKGGGVYVQTGAFNAYGTAITENTAQFFGGGGVFVFDGTFNAYEGTTIRENTAEKNGGGGVYVVTNGTFNATETTIASNTAEKSNGGGVYVFEGIFNAYEGTTITKNEADVGGGVGVYGNNGTFNAFNTTITENIANYYAGGVGVARGIFNDYHSTISSNFAFGAGGVGVAYGTVNSENTIITRNEAFEGGGVGVAAEGVFNARNTRIESNKGYESAGGVGVTLGGVFNAEESVTIKGNRADSGNPEDFPSFGGGVFVAEGGIFYAKNNTTIESNEADYGGGVCVTGPHDGTERGNFYAESVTIKENRAKNVGGGIAWVTGISEIRTRVNTWTPASDQEQEFSVTTTGEIHAKTTGDPVQVFENTSEKGGSQMKVFGNP